MQSLAREDEFTSFDDTADGGLQTSVAPRPFTPEQLVACEECARANPPTRMKCLYCGATLPVTEQSAALRRPTLKKLEEWEQGFNVILLPRGVLVSQSANGTSKSWPHASGAVESGPDAIAEDTIAEAASLLRLDAARLSEMIASCRALPLARAASEEEAALIVERLRALGFSVEVFTDELLSRPTTRVRAFSLEDEALVCWSSHDAEPASVLWSEVTLLVVGRIVTKRVEVEERQTRPGGSVKMVEARELAADEAVLDIYAKGDAASSDEGRKDGVASDEAGRCFRVMADSFDYSCLGERKGLLARDNFHTLVETLRAHAPSAEFDGEYARLRALLSTAWPPAERTGSLGVRREGAGRYNTEAVTNVSNEAQFTRYSRLCSCLAERTRAKS